jgi:hypothetical protein
LRIVPGGAVDHGAALVRKASGAKDAALERQAPEDRLGAGSGEEAIDTDSGEQRHDGDEGGSRRRQTPSGAGATDPAIA